MFCIVSVTLSKLILDVHPRADSTELAEAVPIGVYAADVKSRLFQDKDLSAG